MVVNIALWHSSMAYFLALLGAYQHTYCHRDFWSCNSFKNYWCPLWNYIGLKFLNVSSWKKAKDSGKYHVAVATSFHKYLMIYYYISTKSSEHYQLEFIFGYFTEDKINESCQYLNKPWYLNPKIWKATLNWRYLIRIFSRSMREI